jgi:hypothetical protein
MIDTVCLVLPKSHIVLLDDNNQEIPNWNLQAVTDNYRKYVRNPSATEKRTGLYFPRVTAYDRRYQKEQQVKFEFSVPKLIFNNNIEELSDVQFEEVITALQDRLRRMGIRVFSHILENASVTSVHFGRNFVFRDGQTATNIIAQLQKIDIRKTFDFAKARYLNDGQSLCCHTSAHELVFYDKIADLQKSKKRAIDRDQTPYQLGLFDDVRIRGHPLEVLRMEVRLSQKQKMNAVMRKLSAKTNPTFRDVFSVNLSTKVVRLYWEEIVRSKNQGALLMSAEPIDLVKRIGNMFPNQKPKQLMYYAGLILLAQSGNGLRELRSVLAKTSHDRTWARITKDYREIANKLAERTIRSWVKDIESQITNYSPFKLK